MLWLIALFGCGDSSPPAKPGGVRVDMARMNQDVVCNPGVGLGPQLEYVYVVLPEADQVVAVNPRACTIAATIDVGDEPVFANTSKSGRWVYVTERGDRSLGVIDTESNTLVRHLPLGFAPTSTTFDGTRQYLWIQGEEASAILDIETMELSQGPALPSKVTMTGSAPPRAYAPGGEGLSVLDALNGTPVGTQQRHANALAYSTDADRLVGCDDDGLFAMQPASGAIASQVEAPACTGLRFESCSDKGVLLAEHAVHWLEGAKPTAHQLAVDAEHAGWADGWAVITEPTKGRVHLMRGEEHASIDVGKWTPGRQLRISLDLRHAYLAVDDALLIIDTQKRELRGRVPLPSPPTGVIVAGPVGGTCC